MSIIRIEKRTNGTFREGNELYDDLRTKEVYFLGIKIWGFNWKMNYTKLETKPKTMGFNKH